MIKVIIADDQELIRDSLKIVLEQSKDIEVTATAADGQECLELAQRLRPDVILMDVRMPILDGVEATRLIKDACPETRIIILTTFDDDEYVYNALKFGASGYLLKGVSVAELADSVRTVHLGQAMLNPGIAAKVVRLFSSLAHGAPAPVVVTAGAELSRTERNVSRLTGRGLSNKEIASALALSSGTVRNALSSALFKLGLRDRTQLAIWAVQTGLAAEEIEK